MEFKDYYKILGVDPDADDKTIKTAYRRLARKYHPDVSKEEQAEEKFKELAEASGGMAVKIEDPEDLITRILVLAFGTRHEEDLRRFVRAYREITAKG